ERHARAPGESAARPDQQRQGGGLGPHSRHDEWLPPYPVGEGPGRQLENAPHSRVDRGQEPDRSETEPRPREEQRQQPPRHAVVQVVDQSRLGGGKQARSFQLTRAKTSKNRPLEPGSGEAPTRPPS